MSMLEIHQLALETINEAHHAFLLRFRGDRKIVYGIVEGKDDPMFYRNAIERFLPNDWTVDLIPAGNRHKVIELHDSMNWGAYPRRRVAFFIDQDLAAYGVCPHPVSDNIYVTDGYSIENSIVCSETFIRVLAEAYNVMDATPEESHTISDTFEENLQAFNQAMLPIMAQILRWRIENQKCNLNNLTLSPIFHFTDGIIQIRPDFSDVVSRVNHLANACQAPQSSQAELEESRTSFESLETHERFVRGKYLTWFLSSCLTHMHASINKFVSSYQNAPKPRLPVGPNNIMVLAASRARIPESLRNFIDRTYLAFIAEATA